MEELVRLSLNRPVRLFVDGNTDVAGNLRQEFVRIKEKKEGDREAIVTGERESLARKGKKERIEEDKGMGVEGREEEWKVKDKERGGEGEGGGEGGLPGRGIVQCTH